MERKEKAIVVVAGKERAVEPGVSFSTLISSIALDNRWTNVRVRMIDRETGLPVEVSMSRAPSTIMPGDKIEVFPYDRAA